MSRATFRHTRPKKLNAKQNVQIFREDQVEIIDYDSSRGHIETGVEKNEESEYHLQQAIKASQAADAKVKDAYIPTPPTIASNVQYDVLYPKTFKQPATYIRSSSTVEECAGTPYCMDEEDEASLKLINAQLPDGAPACSEDVFEEVMSFFEETAQNKQPFAAVDNPPVLALEEIEEQYDETISTPVKMYAKFIYEHWKARRNGTGNRELTPHLKAETGKDTDDADPYVCFRRREPRNVRKTRNRDQQSAEKLRALRMQLESAREILQQVKRRELARKAVLETDRELFVQRTEVKETKRKLGIKGDDEDLVNQKKPRKELHLSPSQQALAQQLRMPMGGRSDELRTLEDVQAERFKQIEKEIQNNVERHIKWNEGYVDKTRAPLTPGSDNTFADRSTEFRQAMPVTEYLPTPPASVSDEEPEHTVEMPDVNGGAEPKPPPPPVVIRYQSPGVDFHAESGAQVRRRVGRGGRTIIDRRHLPLRTRDLDRGKMYKDRFRYDSDNDDELEDLLVPDDFNRCMEHKAYLVGRGSAADSVQAQARRAQIDGSTSMSNSNHHHQQSTPSQAGTATS